jgi:hypothetical protein
MEFNKSLNEKLKSMKGNDFNIYNDRQLIDICLMELINQKDNKKRVKQLRLIINQSIYRMLNK